MPMTKCSWCEEETSRVCLICSRPFCQDHASTEQDEFCLECAASPEESRIETTEGLTSEDGTVHKGRSIRAVGPYFISTAGEVSRMSDNELERFYNRYTMLVKQCEEALDRNRVVRSMITMEQQDRMRAKGRGQGAFSPVKRIIKQATANGEEKKLDAFAEVLKRGGFTKEQLMELIAKKKGQENANPTL